MTRVFVVFWFDTEDFVTPESDDALKKLAEILSSNGVRGVFKLVGEKLRVLEKRGRKDVLEALRFHEIGYHTNYHSVHPTVAEYLKDLDFENGCLEFIRRESEGIEDIKRIFKVTPSCYGQPGGAWAPQVYLALRKLNIPVYLDLTDFIGLNGKPFWYCGILNILNLSGSSGGVIGVNFELGTTGFLNKAIQAFDEIYNRIVKNSEWGVISIYNHPCTLVTEEFWDVVNFSRGLNTPLDKLRIPKLKPKEWIEAGYKDFDELIKYIKSKPFVKFVTAKDLYNFLKDDAINRSFNKEEIALLSSNLKSVSFKEVNGIFLSASEIFWLIVYSLAEYKLRRQLPDRVKNFYPLGPFTRFETEAYNFVELEDFLDASYSAKVFIESHGRLPDFIQIGNVKVSPVDFLSSAVLLYKKLLSNETINRIELIKGNFEPYKYISEEGAKSSWKWAIFPEGFEAWNLVELAKLQTWTIKPAKIVS